MVFKSVPICELVSGSELIMKILFLGDIVGRPGRDAVARLVPELKKTGAIDFAAANAENAAGGSGITPQVADELINSKLDVLTSGDHIWKKKEIYQRLAEDPRILRPANYPEDDPGRGSTVIDLDSGISIGIINLVGRVFMNSADCPFKTARREVARLKSKTDIILIDFHAEATSEKLALGYYMDGEITALVGTHTHVQTADERLLPKGTAYITDLGMTGPQYSVIGRRPEGVIQHFLTLMPAKFDMSEEDIELQGVILSLDELSGKARSIKRIRERLDG